MTIELLDLDSFHGNTSDAPREMQAELGLSRDFYFAQLIKKTIQKQPQKRQELPTLQINIFPPKKGAPPETPVKQIIYLCGCIETICRDDSTNTSPCGSDDCPFSGE